MIILFLVWTFTSDCCFRGRHTVKMHLRDRCYEHKFGARCCFWGLGLCEDTCT